MTLGSKKLTDGKHEKFPAKRFAAQKAISDHAAIPKRMKAIPLIITKIWSNM